MREKKTHFESVRILKKRWKDGTFSEILEDWRWILGYSARYKGAILFYVVLGIKRIRFYVKYLLMRMMEFWRIILK